MILGFSPVYYCQTHLELVPKKGKFISLTNIRWQPMEVTWRENMSIETLSIDQPHAK